VSRKRVREKPEKPGAGKFFFLTGWFIMEMIMMGGSDLRGHANF
jgi:hypothetical protein